MSKHVGEKCGELCISCILGSEKGSAHTKIDDTQTSSKVHKKKVIYKIPAQYIKACMRSAENCVFPVF